MSIRDFLPEPNRHPEDFVSGISIIRGMMADDMWRFAERTLRSASRHDVDALKRGAGAAVP